MRSSLVLALLLVAPSPALAGQQSQDPLALLGIKVAKPMSTREMARTKARVADELARAGAAALFDDISDEYSGKARHRPSGLICPLGKKGQRVLAATDHWAACETSNDGAVYRTTVQRAPGDATLQSIVLSAQESARREPGYRPSSGLSVTGQPKPGSGLPEHHTLRYVSRTGGSERAVRAQVGLVRGWILTERRETRNEAQPNSFADILSEATFGLSMKEK